MQLVLQEFTLEQKTNNQHLEALIAAVKNAETKIDASEKGHKIEKSSRTVEKQAGRGHTSKRFSL